MQRLLLFISFLPFTLAAQDCVLKKNIDPVTNAPKLSTCFFAFNSFNLSIDADKKEIDYFFVIKDNKATCLDEGSEMTFVFEGGKLKTEVRNSGSMNCNGIFHLILKNGNYTNTTLQRLSTKKVISLILTVSNVKPLTIQLTEEQQKLLLEKSACIAKEAKTLL